MIEALPELTADERAEMALRENALLHMRLKWARKHCHIIYRPPDGGYPVEHNPFAGKDAWIELTMHADTAQ